MIASILLVTTLLVDTAKSSAHFAVEHVFVERVEGSVPIVSGFIRCSPGSRVPSGISATLDATHIRTGDDDRDGVLQSPDWFETKTYPVWTFVSTNIAAHGRRAFTVDGLLTIRGVTHAEHLDVTASGDERHPVYHATGTVDRKVWGMAITRLDPAIGNPVDVTLDIYVK